VFALALICVAVIVSAVAAAVISNIVVSPLSKAAEASAASAVVRDIMRHATTEHPPPSPPPRTSPSVATRSLLTEGRIPSSFFGGSFAAFRAECRANSTWSRLVDEAFAIVDDTAVRVAIRHALQRAAESTQATLVPVLQVATLMQPGVAVYVRAQLAPYDRRGARLGDAARVVYAVRDTPLDNATDAEQRLAATCARDWRESRESRDLRDSHDSRVVGAELMARCDHETLGAHDLFACVTYVELSCVETGQVYLPRTYRYDARVGPWVLSYSWFRATLP
jgi:hypothetical protein